MSCLDLSHYCPIARKFDSSGKLRSVINSEFNPRNILYDRDEEMVEGDGKGVKFSSRTSLRRTSLYIEDGNDEENTNLRLSRRMSRGRKSQNPIPQKNPNKNAFHKNYSPVNFVTSTLKILGNERARLSMATALLASSSNESLSEEAELNMQKFQKTRNFLNQLNGKLTGSSMRHVFNDADRTRQLIDLFSENTFKMRSSKKAAIRFRESENSESEADLFRKPKISDSEVNQHASLTDFQIEEIRKEATSRVVKMMENEHKRLNKNLVLDHKLESKINQNIKRQVKVKTDEIKKNRLLRG